MSQGEPQGPWGSYPASDRSAFLPYGWLQVNVDGTIKSGSKNLSILTHTPDSGNYIVVPKDALNPDRILAIAINMEGAPNTYGIAIGIGPDPFDIQVSSYIPAGTLADSAFFILVWVGAINP